MKKKKNHQTKRFNMDSSLFIIVIYILIAVVIGGIIFY